MISTKAWVLSRRFKPVWQYHIFTTYLSKIFHSTTGVKIIVRRKTVRQTVSTNSETKLRPLLLQLTRIAMGSFSTENSMI